MAQSIALKIGRNQAHPRKNQQLELDLFADNTTSPADHLRALTGGLKRETSLIWTPKAAEGERWHVLKGTDFDALAAQINQFRGRQDAYITVNEFFHWRQIRLGANLNGFFVDIDMHKGERVSPEWLENWICCCFTEKMYGTNVPRPNLVVQSGRGVHLYWLFDAPVPFKALPRWQNCMRNIIQMVEGDPKAADATRVLRLIGSVNSKSGTEVTAWVWERSRYDFEFLFEHFSDDAYWEFRNAPDAPKTARVRDIRPKQAESGIKRKVRGSIYERWYLVYCDLRWIVENRYHGTVPEGSEARDWMLFMYANALSWFTQSDALEDEILDVGRKITPSLTREQVLAYTATVRKRAEFDAKKLADNPLWESDEWGRSRYRYTRKKLLQVLEDEKIITPDMYEYLRAIVPDHVIRERKTERKRNAYAQKQGGSVRAYGKKNSGKQEQAWILHKDGLSVRQIGEKLEINPATVSRWIKAKIAASPQPL